VLSHLEECTQAQPFETPDWFSDYDFSLDSLHRLDLALFTRHQRVRSADAVFSATLACLRKKIYPGDKALTLLGRLLKHPIRSMKVVSDVPRCCDYVDLTRPADREPPSLVGVGGIIRRVAQKLRQR
jgi:hypothetical protein